MNKKQKLSEKGSFAYENWRLYLAGERSKCIYEFPFYTDAHIYGEDLNLAAPYKLFNTSLGGQGKMIAPAVVLRMIEFKDFDDLPVARETDTDRYHGGGINDEIAALVSLCLGVRMKSGFCNRMFLDETDRFGRPMYLYPEKTPALLKKSERPVLPRLSASVDLEDAHLLAKLPLLKAEASVALIRAARLYQDALWLADSETSLAWVMLVSAMETAAGHWRQERESPIEQLKLFRDGALYHLLRMSGGDELISEAAKLTADFTGSTKKFVDFTMNFLPEPMSERLNTTRQHSWQPEDMKKSLKKIYRWRSQALHGGTPFPDPMCRPPRMIGKEIYQERPDGIAAQTGGSFWKNEDTPMLLHAFEHIVRNCLLSWWNSMLETVVEDNSSEQTHV